MKRFAVALLAAVIGASAAWSTAAAQENPGRHRGHHRQHNWQNGQCYSNNRYGENSQYGQYGQNGPYGQYGQNGQYGQYGQDNRNSNCENAVIRGTIVGVNGSQVTIQQNAASGAYGGYNGSGGYGRNDQTITIDDQPALDNRTSGRVATGRYVTAYGYWQNGVFYATRMS